MVELLILYNITEAALAQTFDVSPNSVETILIGFLLQEVIKMSTLT